MLRLLVLVVAVTACSRAKTKQPEDARESEDLAPADLAARSDKKCAAGDLEACRKLAIMYQEGVGVSRDPKRALAMLDKACAAGNTAACNNLGLTLGEGSGIDKDAPRAVAAFQRACDGGNNLACRNLGLLLRDGRGVPVDQARAEALLDKACKGGVPFACTNAGDLDAALAAKGGAGRLKQALAHYKQGCDAGDPTGCRHIGIAYLEGKAMPRSTSAAGVWLERACMQDDPIACRLLGALVLQGAGVTRDYERGKQLLARACDAKDDEACRLLQLANAPADGGVDRGSASPPSDAHGL